MGKFTKTKTGMLWSFTEDIQRDIKSRISVYNKN